MAISGVTRLSHLRPLLVSPRSPVPTIHNGHGVVKVVLIPSLLAVVD